MEEAVAKPPKEKKPRSPAQIEAFNKGIAKLEANRAAKKAAKEAKIKETAIPVDVVTDPIPPQIDPSKNISKPIDPISKPIDPISQPIPTPPPPKKKYEKKPKDVITKNEFDSFKNELLGIVRQPYNGTVTPVSPAPPAVREVVKEVVKERLISGSALLDAIFFRQHL